MFYIQQSLGIDFRDNQLRLVHLGKNLGVLRLLHAHTAKLPARDITSIDYEESIIAEMLDFTRQHHIKCDNVIFGLPRHEIILRRLTFPPVEKEDLRQIIEFEIDRHIPFPSQEVYFDIHLLGEKKDGDMSILLVAVRRGIVDFYIKLLGSIGLECSVVDITNFSNYGLLMHIVSRRNRAGMETGKNFLMIDIGNREVEMNLVINKRLMASRGATKAQEVESRLNLIIENSIENSFRSSTEEEMTPQQLEASQQTNSLVEFLEEKSNELLRSNAQPNFFGNHNNLVYLFGADAGRALLTDHFKSRVDAEVSILDPFSALSYPGARHELESKELSGALSLALRGLVDYPIRFNLLPSLVTADKKRKNPRRMTAVLLVVFLLLGGANLVGGYVRERRLLKKINRKIEEIKPLGDKAIALGKSVRELSGRKKEIEEFTSYKVWLTNLMLELTNIIPDSVWLERLNFEKNELEIVGYADSASSLISIMEASQYFENVKFTSPITMRGLEKEKFKIKAKLEGKKVENILAPRKQKRVRKRSARKGG